VPVELYGTAFRLRWGNIRTLRDGGTFRNADAQTQKKRTPTPTSTATFAATFTPTPTPTESADAPLVEADRGGTFVFEDGAVRVRIPARAFAQDARLVFKRVRRDNHPKDRNGQIVVNRFSLKARFQTKTVKDSTPKKNKQKDSRPICSRARRAIPFP
jgi:hypothetical protein